MQKIKNIIQPFIIVQSMAFMMWNIPIAFIMCTIINVCFAFNFWNDVSVTKKERG